MEEQELSSVFAALRQARERQDLSLQDAAQAANIPLHYLQALETGQGSQLLADPVYLIPFLRRYAAYLDLDPNEAVRQFLAAPRKSDGVRIKNPPTSPFRPARFSAWLILLVLVVVVGGLVGLVFLVQSSELRSWWTGPVEPSVEAEPEETGPLPGEESPAAAPPVAERGHAAEPAVEAEPEETSPPPGEGRSVAAPPGTEQGQDERDSVEPPVEVEPLPAEAPPAVPQEEQAEAILPTPEPALPSTLPALAPSAPNPQATQLPQAPPELHQLHIQARERTWVRVVIDEGLIQDVVLQPNEQVRWEARDNFTLTVGNAGGVEVTFDGNRLPPLGRSGEVVRQLYLPASEGQ